MAGATFDFDGFNLHLLDENLRPLPKRRRAIPFRLIGGLVLASGVAAGIYWASESGWIHRGWDAGLSLARSIPSPWQENHPAVAPPPVQPPRTVDSLIAERDALLARIAQMEAAAREQAASADLAQLQSALEAPSTREAAPAKAAEPLEEPADAPPLLVARPRAQQRAAAPEKKPAVDQAEIMLFRKQQAERAAAQPIVARTVPAQPVPVGAPASAIEQQPVRQASEQPIRPPALLVEEGGVRVVGAEGERFVPIGSKLNGKRILATSPKIGLIVTEDSAIRVKNQER